MNPCPCGYRSDPVLPCRCTPEAVARYQGRISGPLLDRIDLVVEVPRPEIRIAATAEAWAEAAGEPSSLVRKRVAEGIRFASRRSAPGPGLSSLALQPAAAATLEDAARAQGLSLRAVHRTARVARTIADLSRDTTIPRAAVLEALLFRAGAALTPLKVA